MPEILTESFCERCGTRYTFESAAPKVRLKGLKVMSRGLRNFVMSDDTSMDEAMAAARNETDRELTTHQLDAFHQTFNFCMTCRQYTCGNCWNDVEGRCLSCAPNLGQEVMPAPFGNVAAGGAVTLSDAESIGLHDRNGHDAPAHIVEPMAWPTSDLMREAEAEGEPPAWAAGSAPEGPFAEAPTEHDTEPTWAELAADARIEENEVEPRIGERGAERLEPVAATDDLAGAADDLVAAADDLEPFDFAARLEAVSGPLPAVEPPALDVEAVDAAESVGVAEAAPVDVASPVDVTSPVEPTDTEPAVEPVQPGGEEVLDDRAAAAAAKTSDLLQRFRPGQNLDAEIEAFERAHPMTDAVGPVAAPGPAVTGPVADVEPVAAQGPSTIAAPEPIAAQEPVAAAPEPGAAQEPVAAAPEPIYPEPEPAAVETFAPTEPVASRPEPEPEPGIDYVPQPTWQIVAPDSPASEDTPPPTQQPTQPPADTIAARGEPQWPSTPQWPDRNAAAGLPFLGRPPAATGGIDALWAASAQEVAQVGPVAAAKATGVQPCVSCGLSLSANARFCRRCGTRQG